MTPEEPGRPFTVLAGVSLACHFILWHWSHVTRTKAGFYYNGGHINLASQNNGRTTSKGHILLPKGYNTVCGGNKVLSIFTKNRQNVWVRETYEYMRYIMIYKTLSFVYLLKEIASNFYSGLMKGPYGTCLFSRILYHICFNFFAMAFKLS